MRRTCNMRHKFADDKGVYLPRSSKFIWIGGLDQAQTTTKGRARKCAAL